LENIKIIDYTVLDLATEGRILKWTMKETGCMGTECNWLRISVQWWALVNMVMNLQVPNGEEIPVQLSNHQLLRKGPVLWI
jgi:hypothetical protein